MVFLASTGATPTPTPVPAQITDEQILQMMTQGGGVAQTDPAIVPMWTLRPKAPQRKPAKSMKTYGRLEGNEGTTFTTPTTAWSDPTEGANLRTRAAAETYWLGEMTPEERKAFADKAISAGMWEPKDGAQGLLRAWAQAVDMASSYNEANQDDKTKWISPWEALDKLYAANVAASGGTVDAFGPNGAWRTSTSKQVRNFTEDEIRKTAEQVLQQELGRNPTDSEVAAFTIAANRAAAQNPQVVTEKTRDTQWDSQGRATNSETQRTVSGDTYDPTVGIEQDVRSRQESRLYKAATDYYGAAMQAIGAIV